MLPIPFFLISEKNVVTLFVICGSFIPATMTAIRVSTPGRVPNRCTMLVRMSRNPLTASLFSPVLTNCVHVFFKTSLLRVQLSMAFSISFSAEPYAVR